MALMVSTDTYERIIRDPDDGTEYRVTYRHLSGFERNRIQAMRQGQDDDGVEISMGHVKANAIDLAVVRWTLPFDKTPENIRRLVGEVFDRLYAYVSLDGKEPPQEEEDPVVPLGSSSPATPSGAPGETPA